MSVAPATYIPITSNVSIAWLGAQGLEDVFDPSAPVITAAQPQSNCSAGIPNPTCNFTVMGLNPASSYHALLTYPSSAATTSSNFSGVAVVTIATCTPGAALALKALLSLAS